MDSPSVAQTRKNLTRIYTQTEKNICEALIEHYGNIAEETETQMRNIERAINGLLHKEGSSASSSEYRMFLNKFERDKDSIEAHYGERESQNSQDSTPART